ncbi:hypothetical protein Ocin01_17255 [Orchesella cincta]|uniref:Uncharacterized protein n=1 Tax=Orchesella cincta TaxID=48709 RepID=A0A1D2M8W1_ORCCI|nr:hypothetical protein Ocin01_17255 [Orchesella cincta]
MKVAILFLVVLAIVALSEAATPELEPQDFELVQDDKGNMETDMNEMASPNMAAPSQPESATPAIRVSSIDAYWNAIDATGAPAAH